MASTRLRRPVSATPLRRRARSVAVAVVAAVAGSAAAAGCTDTPTSSVARSVEPSVGATSAVSRSAAASAGSSGGASAPADTGAPGTPVSASAGPAAAPVRAVPPPGGGPGTVETWVSDAQGFVATQTTESDFVPGRASRLTLACASTDAAPETFLVGVRGPVGYRSRARFAVPCDRRPRPVAWTPGSAGDVAVQAATGAGPGVLRWAATLSRAPAGSGATDTTGASGSPDASGGTSAVAVQRLPDAVAPVAAVPADQDRDLARDGQLPGLDGSLGEWTASVHPATTGQQVVIDASCAAAAGASWPVTVSSGGTADGAPALHDTDPASPRAADASVSVPCDGRRHRWGWRVPTAGTVAVLSSPATVAAPRGMLAVVREAGPGDSGLPAPTPGDVLASTPAPAVDADELARSTAGAASQSGVLRRGASYRVTASCDRTAAAVSLRWALTDLGAAPQDGGGSLFGGPGASDGSGDDGPGVSADTDEVPGTAGLSAFRTGTVACDGRPHTDRFLSPVDGPVGLVGDAAADGGWWLVLSPTG